MTVPHLFPMLCGCLAAVQPLSARAGTPGTPSAEPSAAAEPGPVGVEMRRLDIELRPSLHLHAIGGMSDGDAAGFAVGGHDPVREALSAQALEPGISLRAGKVEGFSNYLWSQDAEGDWDGHLEEAFLKLVDLPGGLELRGGRMLSHHGALNERHLHAWDFVNSELAPGRFLGEEGLLLEGGDLSWTLPTRMEPYVTAVATLGFGQAPTHGHAGHAHGEGPEALHEGEESVPLDDVATARLVGRYRESDFHEWTGGLSWAGGTNGFGRHSGVFGIDLQYEWRERGLEAGGRAFRWRNELLWREVEALSAHDDDHDGVAEEVFSGSYGEVGAHSHLLYSFNERWDAGLRLAWIDGVGAFGQAGRFRVSPVCTRWLTPERRASLRAQVDVDAVEGGEDGHALWLQLNILLGDRNEVR